MKKVFALLLALCLLCCGVALADNEKQLKPTGTTDPTDTTLLSLDVAQDYVVTIPSTVGFTLNEAAGTCTATGDVVASSWRLNVGKKLVVKLIGATSLNDAENTAKVLRLSTAQAPALLYKIYKGDDITNAITTIAAGGWEVISVDWNDSSASAPTATLNFEVLPEGEETKVEIKVAGKYTDTLTFSVSIADIQTAVQPGEGD